MCRAHCRYRFIDGRECGRYLRYSTKEPHNFPALFSLGDHYAHIICVKHSGAGKSLSIKLLSPIDVDHLRKVNALLTQ